MIFSVVPNGSPRVTRLLALATRWGVRFGIALLILAPSACTKTIKPGATYVASIITKGDDGKVTTQEPSTRVEFAAVDSAQDLTHEGQTVSLLVRKTQFGKATFDITFPDNATQMAQVKVGETKDVLPKGQKIGVRIDLQESH